MGKLFHLVSIEKAQPNKNLDDALPAEAIRLGYGLMWWNPDKYDFMNPVVLSKQGREVYSWHYVPSMTEVWEKVEALEAR